MIKHDTAELANLELCRAGFWVSFPLFINVRVYLGDC